MANILLIETATTVCSVGVSHDGTLLSIREDTGFQYSHSSSLTVFIEEVMQELQLPFGALDAVAVSRGPGSYTGLRIGVAASKGLCYALNLPLIAVDTLHSLANQCIAAHFANGQHNTNPTTPILFCPMIDARRMEVYCCLYDQHGKPMSSVEAKIIHSESFDDYLQNHQIVFFGSGAAKSDTVIHHPHAVFLDGVTASVRGMSLFATEKFHSKEFEEIAYFEPFYLKDFIAGTPRVKGLR